MICAWLFVPRFLPFIWIFFGLLSVFSFFYFSSFLTIRWKDIPNNSFIKKIFISSIIIRIIYVTFIYFFYIEKTGSPFEFFAGDSVGYHGEANWLMDSFYYKGGIKYYFTQYLEGVSDSGWPFIIALI